jgi:YegS/Rv2252/BmrU family lipid kinase
MVSATDIRHNWRGMCQLTEIDRIRIGEIMKTLLIVNPTAGAGRCGREWPKVERALATAGVQYDLVVTQKRGDATGIAAAALRNGATTIVAVGGDGTANEVANGFIYPDGIEDAPINPAARFGYIPLGTGRDFARALALPADPVATATAVLGPSARTRSIDLGRALFLGVGDRLTRRYFLTGADLGLGAEMVARIETSARWLKHGGGFAAYLLGAIGAINAHRPARIEIRFDDKPPSSALVNIVYVANGQFTGGGMRMAPEASLDDGQFDVLIARGASRSTLLLQLLPAIYRGTHLGHPAVERQKARRVRIEPSGRVRLQMDGEPLGRGPAEFTVVPGILRVLVPG